MDNKSDPISATLSQIVEQYGVDILTNSSKVIALLKDYVPKQGKESRLIASALREGIGSKLLQVANQDADKQRQCLVECFQLLLEEMYITEEAACFTLQVIGSAIGMEIKFESNSPDTVDGSGEWIEWDFDDPGPMDTPIKEIPPESQSQDWASLSTNMDTSLKEMHVNCAVTSLQVGMLKSMVAKLESDESVTTYRCLSQDDISSGILDGRICSPDIISAFHEEAIVCAIDNNKFNGTDSIYICYDKIYLNQDGMWVTLPYSEIREIIISVSELQIICCNSEFPVVISRNKYISLDILKELRKFLIAICTEDYFLIGDDVEKIIQSIIERYIQQISKNSPIYTMENFSWNEKKLSNALHTYARKVRKDEVIAFIDTSLFSNGKDGIMFSKSGIAFDYAFEKVLLNYEEISGLRFVKGVLGEELAFSGHFAEMKNPDATPSINNIYYNLAPLKACLEEICLYF